VEKLVSILTGEMGRSELQGLKPNSQNPKYRLTAKGIALKNNLTNNK
jgi:hypothetical protein